MYLDGERILAARQSPFQRILVTEDESGFRTMRFGEDGVRQSVLRPDDPTFLELPYTRGVPLALAFTPAPRRLLVIGLGGGALPRYFHHRLPEVVIDVVEIDPEVLALARQFCGWPEDERLRVHIGDGRDFVDLAPAPYDFVLLDSYGEEFIPRHLASLEFLSAVRAMMSPGGVVVANIWGRGHNPLYDSMLRTYREAFPSLYVLDVPGPRTKLFFALPDERPLPEAEFRAAAERLMPGVEIAGFRPAEREEMRGGTVLRDGDGRESR